MFIKKIRLNNFRNYENLEVSFDQGINILTGANAQGKTNILEAIYICATGRSFRTSKDYELIRWDQDYFRIGLAVDRINSHLDIDYFYGEKKKKIKINGLDKKKLSELIGEVKVVLFAPENLQLVKAGPSERRKFIDILISQISPVYFYNLQQYFKVLNQRNNLLKLGPNNLNSIIPQLEIWDQQLAQWGSKLIAKRLDVLGKLKIMAQEFHHNLTKGTEDFDIVYKPSFNLPENNDLNLINQSFLDALSKSQKGDIYKGFTSMGPHRDDLNLLVNETEVKNFGSQGQQRTIVLSLKLSEVELIREETDQTPILLLDDVMSELDENRRSYLLSCMSVSDQIFITTTKIQGFEKHNYKVYQVHNGRVES